MSAFLLQYSTHLHQSSLFEADSFFHYNLVSKGYSVSEVSMLPQMKESIFVYKKLLGSLIFPSVNFLIF